jgi:hypothetical protein
VKLLPILALIAFTQSTAHADWLSLCHNQLAASIEHKNASRLAYYFAPDESASLLQLTKTPADAECQQLELNVNAQDVMWAGFASNVSDEAATLALQGLMRNERFVVSEIIPPESTPSSSVEITKKPTELKRSSKKVTKSAWFWSPALWMETPDKIFNAKQKFALNRIYITVPTNNAEVKHATELRKFIAKAHMQNLQVWAVLGDKSAVTNAGAASFLNASAAYGAFNEGNQPLEKLEGLQLDIEPYLISGYAQDPAAWLLKYSDVVNNIHLSAPNLPIDIVLPFWFDPETPLIASMLDDVADSIDRITVMDYRTDLEQIRRKASPFFDWGERNKKAIDIALETLPMPQEERRSYQPAQTGELWRIYLAGKTILLLLKNAQASDAGVISYRFTHTRLVDGMDISFYKDKYRLWALLPLLENDFRARSSFSGLAIHGLDNGLLQ